MKNNNKEKKIDADILPLIKEFNRLGITTLCSCGGHVGTNSNRAFLFFYLNDMNIHISTDEKGRGILGINWRRFKK